MTCEKCGGAVAYPGGGLWRCKVCGMRHRRGGNLVIWIGVPFIYCVVVPALLFAFVGLSAQLITSCSAQDRARNSGGDTTIALKPCERLVNAAWQDHSTDLWLLTRPLEKNENPKEYTLRKHADYLKVEGHVTLIEKACP